MKQKPEEQAFWRQVLERRTQRFSKLVALQAPSYVLCSDLALLVKAVAGLYPEAYGQVQAENTQKESRRSMSRCIFCGAHNEHQMIGEDWCQACEDAARAECEADDEEAEALEG